MKRISVMLLVLGLCLSLAIPGLCIKPTGALYPLATTPATTQTVFSYTGNSLTTGTLFSYICNGLTTGNVIKMSTTDTGFTSGKYITLLGASGSTEVFGIGLGGATTITPSAATVVPLTIDGTLTTSANLLKIKAVDATFNGGKYINLYDGTTSIFSIAEDGATVIGASGQGTTPSVTITGKTSGSIVIAPADAGTNATTIVNSSGGSAKTITLPGATGTLATTDVAQTFTAAQTYGSTITGVGAGSVVYCRKVICTVGSSAGQLNNGNGTTGGTELLAAVTGRAYRVIQFRCIATGATATGSSAVLNIVGTQTTPVSLASITVATLVRSTPVLSETSGCTLLADGASFNTCDAATSIRATFDGTHAITGASTIIVSIWYVVE
jgi:hypothetical protein